MKPTYTPEQKATTIQAYHTGTPVSVLCLQHGVGRSTIYKWIQTHITSTQEPSRAKNLFELERQLKRKDDIIAILQQVSCTVSAPLQDRLYALEELHGLYAVHVLCEALRVDRGTFYNHIKRNKKQNTLHQLRRAELSEKIREIFEANRGIFGANKIKVLLTQEGIATSVKMVSKLMYEMNLESIRTDAKRIYTTRKKQEKKDRVNMQFNPSGPNKIWVSDTTMFYLNQRRFFICAILNLYSRKILAIKISQKHSTQLITSTFKDAYASRQPEPGLMFHSDRGVQFSSRTMGYLLDSLDVVQSFSPTGSPYHNSVMESFFASLKKEELYRTLYRSEQELRDGLKTYTTFDNTERPHGTLSYKTPDSFEKQYLRLAEQNKRRGTEGSHPVPAAF